MGEEKVKGRYFYLMLKESFYDSDDMVLLESMENGYKYSNILLKLYLRSLKDKGKLMYKDRIPYSVEMLAKLTRHDPDTVRRAIQIFQQMGIIEILDNGAIFMMDIENYIGKSSTEADRRRAYDRRIAQEKKLLQLDNPSEESCENSCEKSHEHINIELNTNTNIESNKNLEPNNNVVIAKASDSVSKSQLENEFNELWKKYPNKKDKTKAFKYYVDARKKGTTKEEVELGIDNYNKEIKLKRIEKRFIKHGSTWFYNKCWLDEYDLTTVYSSNTYRRQETVPEWLHKEVKENPATEEEIKAFEKRTAALQQRLKTKYGK